MIIQNLEYGSRLYILILSIARLSLIVHNTTGDCREVTYCYNSQSLYNSGTLVFEKLHAHNYRNELERTSRTSGTDILSESGIIKTLSALRF